MSIEENKRLVQKFCGYFAHSDIASVLDMMTDDATWWINGKPHLFPNSGLKTKAEMAQLWPGLYSALEGGLEMNVIAMIAEGDLVAAEIRSHGVAKSGKVYENEYHFLFRLRDGKVAEVKEYGDMMHAVEVFG